MTSEEEQQLFNEIIDKGCCKRCTLRYLGLCKTLLTFDYPDTCLTTFGFMSDTGEPRNKIRKNNPCPVCLGLLQDETLYKMLEHVNLVKAAEYEHETFIPYITFPTCILLRDHSMKIHLRKSFPKTFDASNVIKVNHAWRFSIENRMCQILNKTYRHPSKLTLHYRTSYVLEEDEMGVIQPCVSEQLSKHVVITMLEKIPDETFEKLIKVPPRVPLYEVQLDDLKCFSEAVHLVGNYCKYSRQLPLSVYAVTDVPAESNVEAIIVNALRNVLSDFKDMVFKASSFDDQSMRVLGTGRKFHLQINDPTFEKVSHVKCKKIEEEIRKSQVMEVKNLCLSDKRDIVGILESEKLSPVSYKVLCLVYACKNIDYCVNAVNMHRSIIIQQKTPLRIVNQRTLQTRMRKIIYIRASKVKGKKDLIELDLCTEAGIHVPEFINGDFGRTKPSLGEIMKGKVECLAIDVVDFAPTLPCVAEPEEVRF